MPDDPPKQEQENFVDYSHETKVATNPALRYLWLGLGFLFTGLGFIGAFLPIMPTTVFLLIAAYFFARSSPRFYNWLMNNRLFGQLLRDWKDGKGIPLRAKFLAVGLISLTIGFSIFVVPNIIVKIILLICGICVSAYLITRPTKAVT